MLLLLCSPFMTAFAMDARFPHRLSKVTSWLAGWAYQVAEAVMCRLLASHGYIFNAKGEIKILVLVMLTEKHKERTGFVWLPCFIPTWLLSDLTPSPGPCIWCTMAFQWLKSRHLEQQYVFRAPDMSEADVMVSYWKNALDPATHSSAKNISGSGREERKSCGTFWCWIWFLENLSEFVLPRVRWWTLL